MRVMLVVTGLMGAGHLARILLIAQALRAAGAETLVVSGGRAIDHLDASGVRVEQLPPVWSDGVDYSRLLTPDGVASAADLDARAAKLVALFEAFAPDALVTELFPFGRRALAGEFTALLTRAKGRARIYASIRDVLEPKRKPGRAAETAARLRAFYDAVLVHGDAALIPLAETWPPADAFASMIRHTGYVAAPAPAPAPEGRGDVLVAVGGGVIGRGILESAIEAARGGRRRWRLRVGGADAAVEAARLQALAAGAPVIVEPAAADYRARLAVAACSVSLLGYNTATDLLTAGTPAVIAPMEEGGEKEQLIRAAAFARLPGFHRLCASDPPSLAAAVETAAAAPGPPPGLVDLSGAETTARIILAG
ncbi:glycosyltransferase [Pikeienuella piscinae]|uniref:Glycosyltransferase n=1 Tax=Pikeienuella piscinae TaxID=2748098 RepID=A0A7M3T594_9RHOB|nr:glycosyltransferase [Pikeienuella piscinae]QIE57175.1 glycosyltransferase [Pikeienuella piscinae]